jgi:predicted choloylglycine hydrolase
LRQTLTFSSLDAGEPGSAAWTELALASWPKTKKLATESSWSEEGESAAVALFAEHMPELVPVLDKLAGALDQPGGRGFLTHTTLKPFFAACSQAGVGGALVRNYDFDPDDCERLMVASRYLRPVIGMQDLYWGLLDGMNDTGLAISLTFGGRFVQGHGFSTLMVIRYLLETCTTVAEAWEKLRTIPVTTAQNLTLVDRHETISVHLGPDIEATRAAGTCVTNHQREPVPEEQENFTGTQRRQAALRRAVDDAHLADDPVEATVQALLRPPLYSTAYSEGLGTVYTAAYRPAEGRVTYIWPEERWEQSFDAFTTGTRSVEVGIPGVEQP